MRLLNDDTNSQVFDICILLTQEEAEAFVSYLRFVLGLDEGEDIDTFIESEFRVTNDPGANSHWHISSSDDRETREIMPMRYEMLSAEQDGWHPRTLLLINDAAGRLDNLGPETH
ncbi:MAG: hypothetical protein HZB26_11670 [Candidatus Hydrogenedentes bacterium]|nr:hypothetical protein [Candidatus Hydrogenedentota bacterium]